MTDAGMDWIDAIWIGSATASLTIGAAHLFIWLRNRRAREHLAFVMVAVGVVGLAWYELGMMHAPTTEELARLQRLAQIPILVVFVAIVAFLRWYFGAGRLWLAVGAVGARLVALAVGFAHEPNVNFREITARQVEFLGQWVTVPQGVASPWTWLARASSLLLLLFILDASVGQPRRGDRLARARAWRVGGSLAFFVAGATVWSALIQHGIVVSPYLNTPFFLAVVLAMGLELTNDVARAADLARRLQESESQAALGADAAEVGAWVWDARADAVWLSDRTRELFGFDEAARPSLDDMLGRIHPDDRASVRGAVEGAMAGDADLQVEYRVQVEGAPVRWVASRGRRDAHDVEAGPRLRGVSVDVTERRHAEAEARRSRDEIAHLSRVALANELSGSLAHELNQPLGAILSNAQAMRRMLDREVPDIGEVRAILEDIIADDQHAADVIRRVRALVARRAPHAETLDLADVVRDALRLVRRELTDRGISLETRLEDGLPAVHGDRVQLRQVVLNLLVNAMDAVADPGLPRRHLHVSASRADDAAVEVRVTDTGCGIPLEILERVFEHFVTTKAEGIGMGLSISRTIVEAHGGRLVARNVDDGGASMAFTLPASRGSDA
jgi:signal transduction histidine kinase